MGERWDDDETEALRQASLSGAATVPDFLRDPEPAPVEAHPVTVDAWVKRVADVLVEHTRMNPPGGRCSCGHEVPLGRSFTEHQAQALADLGWTESRLQLLAAQVATDGYRQRAERAERGHAAAVRQLGEAQAALARVRALGEEWQRDGRPYDASLAGYDVLEALDPTPAPRRCGACRDLSNEHVPGCDGTWGR